MCRWPRCQIFFVPLIRLGTQVFILHTVRHAFFLHFFYFFGQDKGFRDDFCSPTCRKKSSRGPEFSSMQVKNVTAGGLHACSGSKTAFLIYAKCAVAPETVFSPHCRSAIPTIGNFSHYEHVKFAEPGFFSSLHQCSGVRKEFSGPVHVCWTFRVQGSEFRVQGSGFSVQG